MRFYKYTPMVDSSETICLHALIIDSLESPWLTLGFEIIIEIDALMLYEDFHMKNSIELILCLRV